MSQNPNQDNHVKCLKLFHLTLLFSVCNLWMEYLFFAYTIYALHRILMFSNYIAFLRPNFDVLIDVDLISTAKDIKYHISKTSNFSKHL